MARLTAGLGPKGRAKVSTVMHEYGQRDLHSGKGGPVVRNQRQAVAIALSAARKVSRAPRGK